MENAMTTRTGPWEDLTFLPSSPMEPFMLPAMLPYMHPLSFKESIPVLDMEPTSVLDAYLDSPDSSPSRTSESSAWSAQTISRQRSFSSACCDTPPLTATSSSYSYSEDAGRSSSSPLSQGSTLFHDSNAGHEMLQAWDDCPMGHTRGQGGRGDMLHSLLGGDSCDSHTTSTSPHSQEQQQAFLGSDSHIIASPHSHPQLGNSGDVQDLQYLSENVDLDDFDSLMLPPVDGMGPEMFGEHCGLFSQLPEPKNVVPFDNFLQDQPQEVTGLYLVQLLLGCAEAVEKKDYELGRLMLSRLTGMASACGDAMQRIALYFGEALAEQIAAITDTTYIHTTAASSQAKAREAFSPFSLASHVAYQAYYQVLPYVKFAHFTANQAILEAVGSDDRIHIVDLDIGQGLQWPSFIQSLSVRDSNRRCRLKITGVGPDRTTLQQTGRRLCEFAATHNVPLEYHSVVETQLERLHPGDLRVNLGESLAVNCANVLNRSLGNGALEHTLRMINSLNPVVVAVVEVESNDNLPSFLSRFVEALQHYSALFDCLEATLGRESPERLRIESVHFALAIRNILAQETSRGMVRHIRTESWQECFRQAGFKDLDLSGYALYQAKLLLGLFNGAYKLTEVGASLNLGWQDTPIVSVSAWTCFRFENALCN